MSYEHGTLFKHMVHSLTISIARKWCWADLVHRNRILSSMASSLRITLANLALIAMKFSIEWRPLLEEIELEFLDSSGAGSHWRFFLLGLHIFFTLHVHLLSRISFNS